MHNLASLHGVGRGPQAMDPTVFRLKMMPELWMERIGSVQASPPGFLRSYYKEYIPTK